MDSKQDGPMTQQPGGIEDGEGSNLNDLPDLMGQFPVLNAYTHIAFGFELPSDVDRNAVVSALHTGLDRLIEQIPWLGYQMGRKSGVLTTVPWPEDVPRVLLHVKHCDDTVLPMEQLLATGVPISKLDGKVLTPWPALPHPHGITGPVPVITLQANFVRGGLILNFSSHHTVMDGTANFQVPKMLAAVLSGDTIPEAELQQANRDRRGLIELIPRSEPLKDYSHLRRPPGYQFALPASPPIWCNFKMPVASLSKLTKSARDPSRPVTDDDVLIAFFWQRLCAARLARGVAPDTVSKISRAIDARMALGIPAAYLGAQVHMAITRLPMGQVASLTLLQTAQVLRRELAQANTAWAIRSLATFVAREPDRSLLLYNGTHNGNTDVGATSSLNTSQVRPPNWGPLLGQCRFFRRSMGPPIPGSFSVYSPDGGVILMCTCLPADDLEALKKDAPWKQYTRCVG
ncbi:uncharacterized protein B0H64DRAFT_357324 [Chaetomium fimeti]|uniref:Trichothecene 3-O-acetyltransferase-like N-terminal domain-containing protein n=1 Tax=Chaetomium fimeti TaxID=1854472 RepID=A0AAE0LTX3_9PEZI|nr:hypothetical protein B0H64DRAFT_357324 [Chaetomium fimeti]